jgi:tRNA(Ile)-lysidine synthase
MRFHCGILWFEFQSRGRGPALNANSELCRVKFQLMTRLEKKLAVALRQIGLSAQSKVVVAVSGGADSTALLHALSRLRGRKGLPGGIIVAHLNHQLRGEESDEDESFVRRMAERLDLTLVSERIPVEERARSVKKNLEATARQIRYDFLLRAAESTGACAVFTAHTLDDQAETILMRLLRGSGPEGLRGIHKQAAMNVEVQLIRPVLDATRAEVIEHCEHYGLDYRTDRSNLSTDLTRNRIRHEVMPVLRRINPQADRSLARAAELITTDEEFLLMISSELLDKAVSGSTLSVESLRAAHPAIRRRALRMWLRKEKGGLRRIEASHIAAIENLIAGQSGRSIEMPEGWVVSREFDELKIFRGSDEDRPPPASKLLVAGEERGFGDFTFTLMRHLEGTQPAPDSASGRARFAAVLRESPALGGLRLRTREPGDAYSPAKGGRRIKLKTLMIRNKIPKSLRDHYPVLATADDRIVWSPGLPVAGDFAPQPGDAECALVICSPAKA